MYRLSLTSKLAIVVGFISTIIAAVSAFSIIGLVFFFTEREIKDDLIAKHAEVQSLAKPEKSQELADFLRAKDLSLFIFDQEKEVVARYGIYRNLDKSRLDELSGLSGYVDKKIVGFGEYDIYTENGIQLSIRNNVLPQLKRSFYISLSLLLPVIWLLSVLAAIFTNKLAVSPLLKAKNISHELKTPLARVASTLQLILPDLPNSLRPQIENALSDLLHLGSNVDSLLSLSLARKHTEGRYGDVVLELHRTINRIKTNLILEIKTPKSLIVPVSINFINILLRNLVDNAVKYNVKNGYILIKIKRLKDVWTLQIENSTDKLKVKKGHGLGMTIVSDICYNQGLQMKITNKDKFFAVKIRGQLE
jgi:two-component system OmpR family sensor kinase